MCWFIVMVMLNVGLERVWKEEVVASVKKYPSSK
jgi:hypothetical protein